MRITTLLSLITIVILSGCQSTQFTATWTTDNHEARQFNKLLIVGMSRSIPARTTVEDEVVYYMRVKQLRAVAGSDVLPVDRSQVPKEKEAMQAFLKKNGIDGILTVSLLDVKKETKYVQGSNYYAPTAFYGGYYGSFYNYYPSMYSNVYQPGYYANSQVVYLETNLFDVETGDLIWSAQSDTQDKTEIDDLANSYARGLVTHVVKRKILKPQE
jgi:hypothetical protein